MYDQQAARQAGPVTRTKRVIGPVCPRDASGKFKLPPILGKRVKSNLLGEPERDDKGRPVVEEYDTRSPVEYQAWEPNQQIPEDATKGLSLWKVDYRVEPSMLVYARNETDAIETYRKEMGIAKFDRDNPPIAVPHK